MKKKKRYDNIHRNEMLMESHRKPISDTAIKIGDNQFREKISDNRSHLWTFKSFFSLSALFFFWRLQRQLFYAFCVLLVLSVVFYYSLPLSLTLFTSHLLHFEIKISLWSKFIIYFLIILISIIIIYNIFR